MTYSKNGYLTIQQMTVNAQYILNYLLAKGWTKNAICGMLGNMQTESTINPGIWQSLDAGNFSGGYGLVQWTPASKYISWCQTRTLNYSKMDSNLKRIEWEVENNEQWIDSTMTFLQFTQSKLSAKSLGMKFIKAYERPADPNQPIRGEQAQYWFDSLEGEGSGLCIQLAQFPMNHIEISQGEDGDFSHQGKLAIDFVGNYIGMDKFPYYAPVDCTLVMQDESEALNEWVSDNEVMCADGQLRTIKWWCIHEEPLSHSVGTKLLKGELMGHSGTGARATGDHLHLQAWDFITGEALHLYDVFSTRDVILVQQGNDYWGLYPWKISEYVDCSDSPIVGNPVKKDKKKEYVKLLLCDAVNGWKF